MKNKTVKTFEEHTENLNISGVILSQLKTEMINYKEYIDKISKECRKNKEYREAVINETFSTRLERWIKLFD